MAQAEANEVTHSVELGKPDRSLRGVPALLHKELGSKLVAAFVVASHHKGNSPGILRTLKGFKHNVKACIVLPISGGFIGLNGGGVALCRGAIALLFHVGPAHELHSVVVSMSLCMRQIFLKLGNPPYSVALYRGHYHGLVAVEFLHCLAGKTVDGSLNPGFFGIDH